MSMGGHQSARVISDVWLTPPEIISSLGSFDLDPCAAPEPRPWPTARQHITLPGDGLRADWKGARVWMNPPYSDAGRWVRRLSVHGHGTALVFARTEPSWFWEYIWRRSSALLFITGRLHFYRATGLRAPMNAGAPSVLVAYGPGDADALASSGVPGAFIRHWQVPAEASPPQLALFPSPLEEPA